MCCYRKLKCDVLRKIVCNIRWIHAGADCNLGPTWEQNSCVQREKIFCSRVSLKCSQVGVFWGQLGMFQGQYTVQVAPQTAPMAYCYKLNDKNPSYQTWESLVLIFIVENNTQE